MATTHISFDDQSNHGRILRRCLNQLDDGHRELNEIVASMATMIDGDVSNADNFTMVTAKFGFDSNILAKAAWDELNSVMFKLNTNDAVPDVNAALRQVFSRFRG